MSCARRSRTWRRRAPTRHHRWIGSSGLVLPFLVVAAVEGAAQSPGNGFTPPLFGPLVFAAGGGYPAYAQLQAQWRPRPRWGVAGGAELGVRDDDDDIGSAFFLQLSPASRPNGHPGFEGSALEELAVRPIVGWTGEAWYAGANIELPVSFKHSAVLLWAGHEVQLQSDGAAFATRVGLGGVPGRAWSLSPDLSLFLTAGARWGGGHGSRFGAALSLAYWLNPAPIPLVEGLAPPTGEYVAPTLRKPWNLAASLEAIEGGVCTASYVTAKGPYWQGKRDKRYTDRLVAKGGNEAGNHIQGIQRDGTALYLTGSDWSAGKSHLFMAGRPEVEVEVIDLPSPLPHPGGFQMQGGMAAIPFEGDKTEHSEVRFFRAAEDFGHLRQLDLHRDRVRLGGAAGWTLLPDTSLLLGVWWDDQQAKQSYLELHSWSNGEYRVVDDTVAFGWQRQYQSIAFMSPRWIGSTPDTMLVSMVGFYNTQQAYSDRAKKGLNQVALHTIGIPATAFEGRGEATNSIEAVHTVPLQRAHGSFSAGAGLEVLPDGRVAVLAASHYRTNGRFRLSVCTPPDSAEGATEPLPAAPVFKPATQGR